MNLPKFLKEYFSETTPNFPTGAAEKDRRADIKLLNELKRMLDKDFSTKTSKQLKNILRLVKNKLLH